tara:strand:+ start:805 stop:1146 length:342 start_codon:yes stop_codon:yes gene_type:complete
MVIKTKIDVTYNSGVTGTSQGIVIGALNDAAWFEDFNKIGVNYQYADLNGAVFHTSSFVIANEQVEAMYEAIKASLPTEGTYRDIERNKFYLGFVFQMAATFGIPVTDIEIVA